MRVNNKTIIRRWKGDNFALPFCMYSCQLIKIPWAFDFTRKSLPHFYIILAQRQFAVFS